MNLICPGIIDTPMHQRGRPLFGDAVYDNVLAQRVHLRRAGRLEEIAHSMQNASAKCVTDQHPPVDTLFRAKEAVTKMLGDQIAEETGKVAAMRVLDAKGPRVEGSARTQGKALGVDYQGRTTYTSEVQPGGFIFGEGQGVYLAAKAWLHGKARERANSIPAAASATAGVSITCPPQGAWRN